MHVEPYRAMSGGNVEYNKRQGKRQEGTYNMGKVQRGNYYNCRRKSK